MKIAHLSNIFNFTVLGSSKICFVSLIAKALFSSLILCFVQLFKNCQYQMVKHCIEKFFVGSDYKNLAFHGKALQLQQNSVISILNFQSDYM